MLPYLENSRPHQNWNHRKRSIRVRDLLVMMSGIDADDSDTTRPGCENNMLESVDWIRYGPDLPIVESLGRRWIYAGMKTMLLAGVLKSATQRPVIEFAKDTLFEPLGIKTLHWERTSKGIVVGQDFLSLRGRDQLKLGQLSWRMIAAVRASSWSRLKGAGNIRSLSWRAASERCEHDSQTFDCQLPLTSIASSSPGQGGMVTPIAAKGSSPKDRN